MNMRLGLRTLALLALVAGATAILLWPGMIDPAHARYPALHTMLSMPHN